MTRGTLRALGQAADPGWGRLEVGVAVGAVMLVAGFIVGRLTGGRA